MTLDQELKQQLYFDNIYKSGAYLDTKKALSMAMDSLELRISKLGDSPTRRKLEQLYADVYKEINEAYKPLPSQLTKELTTIGSYTYTKAAGVKPSIKQMKDLISSDDLVQGYSFKELFKAQELNHARQIKTRIAAGIASGSSLDTIVRDIRSKNFSLTKNQLKTAVNTTITETRTKSQYKAFKDIEDDNEVYESVAVLDSRTSETCRSLDGRKYRASIDDVPNKPPRHFNCRSRLVQVVDGYQPMTRASVNGPVDASLTYKKWEEAQSFKNLNNMTTHTVKGIRTAMTMQTQAMALDSIEQSGIKVGAVNITGTKESFRITAKKGGFEYALKKIGDIDLILDLLVLPKSKRGMKIGTEALKDLKAIQSSFKVKNLLINAGDATDFKESVYGWIASGLAEPQNKDVFLRELLKTMNYEDFDRMEFMNSVNSRGLVATFKDRAYQNDIKNALNGSNYLLKVL